MREQFKKKSNKLDLFLLIFTIILVLINIICIAVVIPIQRDKYFIEKRAEFVEESFRRFNVTQKEVSVSVDTVLLASLSLETKSGLLSKKGTRKDRKKEEKRKKKYNNKTPALDFDRTVEILNNIVRRTSGRPNLVAWVAMSHDKRREERQIFEVYDPSSAVPVSFLNSCVFF
jgi:hypothetical protein